MGRNGRRALAGLLAVNRWLATHSAQLPFTAAAVERSTTATLELRPAP